ncbi:6863_t:CDS:2 [Entrophospora sp. SA101]|nr:6863_t:CDS:2 [Entrophospora sp. SA101]
MLTQELDLYQKTIYQKFPTFAEFHHEALNEMERILQSSEDETNFSFYAYCVYDRERLWSNIFEHLKLEMRVEATVDTGYLGTEKDQDDTSHKADKAKEDSKETDHGTIDKTITSQEQPVFYQQLARIMPSFSLVETRMEDLTDFSHLFDNVFVPQGELRWNPQTFQLDYLTRTQLIEEQAPEKKREKPTKDPDQDLSLDE